MAGLSRVLALLAPLSMAGLLLAGCGTATGSAGSSDFSAGAAGNGSTAGSDDSGGSGNGGSSSGAGSSGGGRGGNKAGGSASVAGSGGVGMASGCHTAADCPTSNLNGPIPSLSQCLSPGQSPPAATCGAVGWCGQCNCGPQPQAPLGNGMSCQTSADCPAASSGVATASVCDMGLCTQCATSSDCPASAPACGTIRGTPPQLLRVCVECLADSDCPSAKPHCGGTGGISKCGVCASDQDCATGICSDGACMPGCTAQSPCPSPLTACAATERCEALTCETDAACPANATCQQGHCLRRSCTKDGDCDSGGCVNGVCYETLGTCNTQTFPP